MAQVSAVDCEAARRSATGCSASGDGRHPLPIENGLPVEALPNDFGSGSTCHLRFQKWVQLGVFAAIHCELLTYYDGRRGIAWN